MQTIHLDDYLDQHQGEYVRHLDMHRLKAAVAAAPAAIVEGVCVLQVLEKLGVEPDAFVYVKRTSDGDWLDEGDLDPELPIEEHLANLRESIRALAKRMGESGELGPSEEVIRYHAKYCPHTSASLIFLRDDS